MFNLILDAVGVVFLGVAFLLLVVSPRIRIRSRAAGPFVAVMAAAICLFFGNLDHFESVEVALSGFKAKTRELQGVIDDAKATVTSLHELAVTTAALQVDLLASEGRWGGPTTILHKDEQKAQLLARLKALGLTGKELAQVETADRHWVLLDYAVAVLKPLNDANDPQKGAEYTKAFYGLEPPTPDECERLLAQFNVADAEIKELLSDYRYYFQTNKQRRPDVWRNRSNW